MSYDKNNIFARILRGEIPCKKIYENEYILSFYDVNPQKKIHALVIPKGEYVDLDDFSARASEKEITELIKGITFVAKKLGISINGGLGSVIAEICSDECLELKSFKRIGLNDVFSSVVGDQEFLREYYSMDAESIYTAARRLV